MEDKGRQAQCVVAMEVGQENSLDGAGIHAAAVHMRQQRRAAIQEQAPVDDHRPVVSLRGECRAGPQKS
jgi:hypothetical protein